MSGDLRSFRPSWAGGMARAWSVPLFSLLVPIFFVTVPLPFSDMSKVIRLNVRFDADTEAAIAAESERTRASMADVARSCVCEVLLGQKSEKIGITTESLIREGLLNAEVLAGVREIHGENASSTDSVAW